MVAVAAAIAVIATATMAWGFAASADRWCEHHSAPCHVAASANEEPTSEGLDPCAVDPACGGATAFGALLLAVVARRAASDRPRPGAQTATPLSDRLRPHLMTRRLEHPPRFAA